ERRLWLLSGDTARARVRFRPDVATGTLDLRAPDRPACRAAFGSASERAPLEAYVNDVLGTRPDGPGHLVEAGPQSFTDVPQNCLSMINLASVRELESRVGRHLHPLRFR